MQYRRSNIGGDTYFFLRLINLAEHHRSLWVDKIDTLRDLMKKVK